MINPYKVKKTILAVFMGTSELAFGNYSKLFFLWFMTIEYN